MAKMKSSSQKAIIIGAGIGGLCAGLALHKKGWQIVVLEKSDSLTEGGAGIVLAANAIKALQKLGAAEQIKEQGMPVGKAEIRTWDGRMIMDLPIHEQGDLYGTPSYLIHRSRLQSILYHELTQEATVTFDKRLVDFEYKGEKVTALFEDGTKETADVLIGADGVHSIVREKLHGRAALRYSGFSALRGIAIFDDVRYSRELGGGFEAWGRGKRFGFSHLGEGQVFWFAAINAKQGAIIPQGMRKYAALESFRNWCKPIEAVIGATDDSAILAHDIFDCKPLQTWSKGRVTLLGDAAHPMLPNLGQGGAQAMEDAIVLADCLADNSTAVPSALQAYEQRRIPRTTRIVRESRRMGRLVQLENAAAITTRNLILRTLPPGLQVRRLHWLIGYEV
jgi:2-polyprenyl-6-methoxyphenol hydroxylase-like FAD-dependent oxidoreductase